MAFGSSVLTHKKEQQIKIAGEFKPTVDCLCAIRRGFVAVYASYSYLGNKNYSYFDNQFMFVMFHYGIFPVIAWLCVYASTLKGSKIYNEQSRIVIRAAKFVGFFVLLAYMGVSTYYQIELGYSGVIVMMLIGKALREKYYGRS